MSLVDQYAPCPCGSGKKYKFCCQKAETFIKRVTLERENGQREAEARSLDEGLARFPDVPWLLLNKANAESQAGRPDKARDLVARVLKVQPDHPVALSAMARLLFSNQSDNGKARGHAGAVVELLQNALNATTPERRHLLAELAEFTATVLIAEGHPLAAARHAELADMLDAQEPLDPKAGVNAKAENDDHSRGLELLMTPAIVPWAKQPPKLAAAPEDLSEREACEFEEAVAWVHRGYWLKAVERFERFAKENKGGVATWLNLGLTLAHLGRDRDALASLRRVRPTLGETEEAVDLECLCQSLTPLDAVPTLERVQLVWPLRDRRAALERILAEELAIRQPSPPPQDPDDPNEPTDLFLIVDRPPPPSSRFAELTAADLPRELARLYLFRDKIALETFENEGLAGLQQRITGLLGDAVPPAHPKTEVVGREPTHLVPLRNTLVAPPGLPLLTFRRFQREELHRLLHERWPDIPHPTLNGRTPRQAAEHAVHDSETRIVLRAMFLAMEVSVALKGILSLDDLRQQLGLAPEPPVVVELVEGRIDFLQIPAARLHLIQISESFTPTILLGLYFQAKVYAQLAALYRFAQALARHQPEVLAQLDLDLRRLYGDLLSIPLLRGDAEEALRTIEQGRQADPLRAKGSHAATWDLLEARVRSQAEPPESWVPLFQKLFQRYSASKETLPVLIHHLSQLGLVRLIPHPEQPDTAMLDTAPLDFLIARYGSKIIPATRHPELGDREPVRPKIWIPGGDEGSGSAKSLILPGR